MGDAAKVSCSPGQDGTCPHCGREIQFKRPEAFTENSIGLRVRDDDHVRLVIGQCPSPACGQYTFDLVYKGKSDGTKGRVERLHPLKGVRPAAPPEVPADVRSWYDDAAKAEGASDRGAAALARACLQAVLRDQKVRGQSLDAQIARAMKDKRLPTSLGELFDLVRQVGNYAVHPTKGDLGSFLAVEPGEVDMLFEALGECFDVFYVKPERQKLAVERVNEKLPEGKRIKPRR